MPRALPAVLFVYGSLWLGLALNPTPNPYQKPRAMLYKFIKSMGLVYRTNIIMPTQWQVVYSNRKKMEAPSGFTFVRD